MWWSRIRAWTPTVLLLACFAGAIPLWFATHEAAESIKVMAQGQDAYMRAASITPGGQSLMSYSKVTVRNGGPNGDIVAEYTNVTHYTDHDTYVSFDYGENGSQHQTIPAGTYWIHCE